MRKNSNNANEKLALLQSGSSVQSAITKYGDLSIDDFVRMEIEDPKSNPNNNSNSSRLAQLRTAQAAVSLTLKSAYRNTKHYSKKPLYYTGQAAFHTLDFLHIQLVTQMRASRLLRQLFHELAIYDLAPSAAAQQMWIGWPIIFFGIVAAITAKSVNHLFEYKGKEYPAVQSYLFTAFSSSILYFAYDALSSSGRLGAIPIGYFIAISVLSPIMSAISTKFVIPDAANRITLTNTPENKDNFPTYPDASRSVKVLDILVGFSYSSCLFVLFWLINRELNSKTVKLEYYQIGIAMLGVVVSGTAGYFLTQAPKVFHAVASTAKTIIDGGLSYGSLSAIGFQVLMFANQCEGGMPCWDPDIEKKLSIGLPMVAIAVGLFAGATLLVQYKKEYENNLDFLAGF